MSISWYKISANDKIDQKELEMGIKVEKEHLDIYRELKGILGDDIPWSENEFAEKIAKAHIRELKDYYSRLKIMEAK